MADDSDKTTTPSLATRLIAGIAFAALLAMVAIAVVDIVLRLISRLPGAPLAGIVPVAVPGVVDLVELTLVTVAHLSVALTFLVGAHVTVDVIAVQLPERVRSIARRICWALSFAFMTLCFVQSIAQLRGQWAQGLMSATINLPVWWYWIPVVAGTALAAVACFRHLVARKPAAPGHGA